MHEREIAGGGRRRKVLGVCAVCGVTAGPAHWWTDSHREKAVAWERARDREQQERAER